MMFRKVRIIDSLSYKTFHEVFNSNIIYICLLVYKQVEIYCSNSTYHSVCKLIKRYNTGIELKDLKHEHVNVIERDDTVGGLLKYLISAALNIWYYIFTPYDRQIIYLNNNPLSLWVVCFFNFFFKKKVVIFCHGELDLLIRSPKIYKPSFYYKYIFLLLFKYGVIGENVKMFVLSDSILSNVYPYLNKRNKNSFKSIDHPYFFRKFIDKNTCENTSILKIGTVGALTFAKGLQSLLDLSNSIDPSKIQLSVVGRIMDKIDKENYPNIRLISSDNGFIPREDFEEAIKDLDYILFLYPTDSYQFIASGAVFDAMDLQKPIITLANDYFKSILKIPIGYICYDACQILETVNYISDNRLQCSEQYLLFKENIISLQKQFTPEYVAQKFISQLS